MLRWETFTVFFENEHHHHHHRLYSPGRALAFHLRTIRNLDVVCGQNLEFWDLKLEVSEATTGPSGANHLTISAVWKTHCNAVEQVKQNI